MSNKTKGFASMPPEKRRALQSRGGRNAHKLGKAHRFTREEASRAGKIGGPLTHLNRGKKARHGRLPSAS